MGNVYLKLNSSSKSKDASYTNGKIYDSTGKLIGKYKNSIVYSTEGNEIGYTNSNTGYYYSAKLFSKSDSNTIYFSMANKYYIFDGDIEEALACCIARFHQIKDVQPITTKSSTVPLNQEQTKEEKGFVFK